MVLRKKYVNPAQAIASYDFFDIAAGTGLVTFYAGDVNLAAGTQERILSTDPFYATIGASSTGLAQPGDFDFDVTINKPIQVKGIATVSVPILLHSSSGTHIVSGAITATIEKNGVDVATGTSETIEENVAQDTDEQVFAAVKVNVLDKTLYESGDVLRLRVQYSAPQANSSFTLGHDPMGRLTVPYEGGGSGWAGQTTTALTFHLPVVVDI